MKERPKIGFATDNAHSIKERLTRYRAVDLFSEKEIFYAAIGNWTNNIGEFLGIVEALKYVLANPDSSRIIYSDSEIAITYGIKTRKQPLRDVVLHCLRRKFS